MVPSVLENKRGGGGAEYRTKKKKTAHGSKVCTKIKDIADNIFNRTDRRTEQTGVQNRQADRTDRWTEQTGGQKREADRTDR